MYAWIRLMPVDPLDPESWHLQIGITHNGLRVAACGDGYTLVDLMEVRPFAEVPSLDICEECAVAHRRMSAAAGVVPG